MNVGVTGDVGKDGTVSVGKLRASADVAFSNGDVDNAINILGKVIELEPKNENNFYKRFRFYIRQHKYKEALQDLNRYYDDVYTPTHPLFIYSYVAHWR